MQAAHAAQAAQAAQVLAQGQQEFSALLTQLGIPDVAILDQQQQVIHPAASKRDFLVQLYGTLDMALEATERGLLITNIQLFAAVGFTEAEWMKLARWLLGEAKRQAAADARKCLLL